VPIIGWHVPDPWRLSIKPEASAIFPPRRTPHGGNRMNKIDIASLPELATSVGIHGSTKQKEVGGAVCIGILIGVAVYSQPEG
jgi:hypothetical protein